MILSMQEHVFGDKPVTFQVVSDQVTTAKLAQTLLSVIEKEFSFNRLREF